MLHWIDTVFPRRALFQRDRRLLHLFAGRVLASTGFAIVLPFLSLYLHGTRGIPMSLVGSVFLIGGLTGALGQIVGGEWADRSGRKIVLVASQVIRSFAFLGLGVAVMAKAPFIVFALLTAVSAFAGRMFEPPSGAMIADLAQGERRSEYYGILRIGGNLGWALGPAIGGFLAALSFASLFLVSAGVLLLAAALMTVKVEETSPRHRARRGQEPALTSREIPEIGQVATGVARIRLRDIVETLRERIFLRYCLITLIFFTVMSQLISTLSVYTVEWAGLTKIQLGTIYTLNGLMVVFLQFPATRATASIRLTSALALGSVLYGIGYGMMGFVHGMALLCVAMFVVTLGEMVATPPSMHLATNFASDTTRGRYMGMYGLFNSLGWSLGPLVGGILLDVFYGHASLVWGTICGLALLAALGYADLRRRIDPELDRDLETRVAGAAVAQA